MKIRLIGLDHKTAPVDVREKFSFNRMETVLFLRNWIEIFPDFEAVLLSTCNRTELYVGTQNGALPPTVEILHFIINQKKNSGNDSPSAPDARGNRSTSSNVSMNPSQTVVPLSVTGGGNPDSENPVSAGSSSEIPPFIQVKEDAEAVDHLFSVAASLESMVLGEPQILAQIKEAYRIAAEEGVVGIMTNSVFQRALRTAKRISVETELFRHRISLPAIAVSDFALEIFERLTDKRALVLGAGEMAEETLLYLADGGIKEIVIANRSREKADTLAERFGGRGVDWEARFAELADADLVVAATGASEPIITPEDYRRIAAQRFGRPLFMVDLSVPRNLDENLGRFPNVYLYSLDDLQGACDRNRKSRNQEIPRARRIVRQETESFMKELRLRDSGQLIRELRQQWNHVKESEVERLFHKCHDFDPREQNEIRYAFDRLVNKLLHPPMESLRDENEKGRPTGLMEAMMKLFRLK